MDPETTIVCANCGAQMVIAAWHALDLSDKAKTGGEDPPKEELIVSCSECGSESVVTVKANPDGNPSIVSVRSNE